MEGCHDQGGTSEYRHVHTWHTINLTLETNKQDSFRIFIFVFQAPCTIHPNPTHTDTITELRKLLESKGEPGGLKEMPIAILIIPPRPNTTTINIDYRHSFLRI